MVRSDPYTPEESWYECVDCGARVEDSSGGSCPECRDGTLANVSVPRE